MINVKRHSDHPSDTELDALRAGLYDARVTEREALRAHLAECAECGDRVQLWTDAKAMLATEAVNVRTELRARRAAALAGNASVQRPARWGLPMALAAGVAALAVALGVALYTPENSGDVQIAESEVPDLYTDIDFYLWLLRKQQDEAGSSG